MPIKAEIAGIACHFDDLGSNAFFGSWRWSLDPYNSASDASQLKVERAAAQHCPSIAALPLLYQEPSGFFSNSVHRLPEGSTLWTMTQNRDGDNIIAYSVNDAWDTATLLNDRTESCGHMAFEYISKFFPAIAINHGVLSLHGALLEHEGSGMIVSAPSGVGKTTHARLWRDTKNAIILNGDRAVCRKTAQGWQGFGTPWSGTSGEQVNRSVPLQAIIALERGEENSVIKLEPASAFEKLFPNLLYPNWERSKLEQTLALFDDLLKCVPIFCLRCLPNAEAVELLYQRLKCCTN